MTVFACYDRHTKVIWGTGKSAEAAEADARDWISRNTDGENPELECNECSHELALDVAMCGGQLQWEWAGTPDARVMVSLNEQQ